MESLEARLDSVLNKQLDLIEEDSNELAAQIEYWRLVKEENLILYAARKRGLSRLGLNPVPNLQVSEARAKNAIELGLLLQSLANSRYGRENWNRRQTSWESYVAPPQYCFKKGPSTVTVRWDGDENNESQYTAWSYVYCQDDSGEWDKVKGQLDYNGLFYVQDNITIYYDNFADDSQRYSHSNYWEVYYNDKLVSPVHPPVHTSPSSSSKEEEGASKKAKRPLAPRAASPPSKRRGRGGGGGGRRLSPTPEPGPSRSPPQPRRATVSASPRSPYGLRRRGGGTRRGGRGGRRLHPVEPGDVGTVHSTPARKHKSRVEALLEEARDPFLLVCAGKANSLKCMRYRIRSNYQGLFTAISQNFKWAEGEGQGSGSRMLVAFASAAQRTAFRKRARLPQSVKVFDGNFDSY